MKLGAFVQQGQKGAMIHYGPLGKYIQMVRALALIYPIMKPEFAEKILTDLWDSVPYAPPDLVGYYFILEVDGLSNTITICPPLYYPATGTVEMDREQYNKVQRDNGLPNLTLSWDDILAFRFLNVRELTAKKEDRLTDSGGEELTSETMAEVSESISDENEGK